MLIFGAVPKARTWQNEAFWVAGRLSGRLERHRKGNRPRTLPPRSAVAITAPRRSPPGGRAASGRLGREDHRGRRRHPAGAVAQAVAGPRVGRIRRARHTCQQCRYRGNGLFASAGPERLRQLMDVNFFALAEMTLGDSAFEARHESDHRQSEFHPGRRGVPHNSEYCASKFAVHGFSEALRTDWPRRASMCWSSVREQRNGVFRSSDRSQQRAGMARASTRHGPRMSPREPWPPCGRGNVRSSLISGAGFSAS